MSGCVAVAEPLAALANAMGVMVRALFLDPVAAVTTALISTSDPLGVPVVATAMLLVDGLGGVL